jgi:hypothetical protein
MASGDRAATRPGEGPPPGVSERLAALRALYVPERDGEARAHLARDRLPPPSPPRFEVAVAARLRELRALCDLAGHLHRAKIGKKIRVETDR